MGDRRGRAGEDPTATSPTPSSEPTTTSSLANGTSPSTSTAPQKRKEPSASPGCVRRTGEDGKEDGDGVHGESGGEPEAAARK